MCVWAHDMLCVYVLSTQSFLIEAPIMAMGCACCSVHANIIAVHSSTYVNARGDNGALLKEMCVAVCFQRQGVNLWLSYTLIVDGQDGAVGGASANWIISCLASLHPYSLRVRCKISYSIRAGLFCKTVLLYLRHCAGLFCKRVVLYSVCAWAFFCKRVPISVRSTLCAYARKSVLMCHNA